MSASKATLLDSRENPGSPSSHFLLPLGVCASSAWLLQASLGFLDQISSRTDSRPICRLALRAFPQSLRQAHDLHIFRVVSTTRCPQSPGRVVLWQAETTAPVVRPPSQSGAKHAFLGLRGCIGTEMAWKDRLEIVCLEQG